MTREAVRFPYGSAGVIDADQHVTAEEPRPAAAEVIEGVATPAQLKALADFAAKEQARHDKWRHTAGLDSNWHGQIVAELKDTL